MYICSFSLDLLVEKCAEFMQHFSESVEEQLNFSHRAICELQQLLDLIDSYLKKDRNPEIEDLKKDCNPQIEELKEGLKCVLSRVNDSKNACVKAATRGSCEDEIEKINQAIRQQNLRPLFTLITDILGEFRRCSQCLATLKSECM